MAQPTTIEWVQDPRTGDRGFSWNVCRGCSRVSRGCENCYAERIAARFSKVGLPYRRFAAMTPRGPRWTGRVELIESKLEEPLRRKRPTLYFVNSMSDLFHENLADQSILEVMAVMRMCTRHLFIVPTKRAKRMCDLLNSDRFRVHPKSPCPNVWLGISAEDQATADERIPWLLKTPAAVRLVSLEPLLGPIDLTRYIGAISWCVMGGESGPGARPSHPDSFRRIRDDCQAAGVPFFFKQHGAWLHHSQEAHLPGLYTDELSLEAGDYHQHLGDLGRLRSPKKGSGPHLAGELYHKSIESFIWPDGTKSFRVGKTAAGRLLDGRTWDEMPRK